MHGTVAAYWAVPSAYVLGTRIQCPLGYIEQWLDSMLTSALDSWNV